jgi:hypothetical protein
VTEKENKLLLKLIAQGINNFPKVLARKRRAYEEKKKRLKAFRPIAKAIQKRIQTAAPVHPWRICPAGQFYRRSHIQKPYHRASGVPVRGSVHPKECIINRTGKDQLYAAEMHKIAELYFETVSERPSTGISKEFPDETRYDKLIAGWCKYWNDVLKPSEPVDPNLVKALIATESAFNPKAWNKKKGRKSAHGLMQVTHESVDFLSNRNSELNDHFVNLKNEDMLDPNLSICAGIRWLFRKREIARSKNGGAGWLDTILLYKNYESMSDEQMKKLVRIYSELKVKSAQKAL